MTDDEYRDFLLSKDGGGYIFVVKLSDGGWVGIAKLIYTWALCIELDMTGYGRRYCFDAPDKALTAALEMETLDDVPAGWIAQREGLR